jgi:hypothetical protein
MIEVQSGSCLEWLTATGWKVELDGSAERVRGSARKVLDAIVLEVSAEAETVRELAWSLVELAADALEACGGSQDTVAAA